MSSRRPHNAAAVVMWLACAAPAWAAYDEGLSAYRLGDFRAAHAEFRPAAEGGDANAQYMLGQMYERGQEVVLDPAQAFMWYTRAAARGHVEAGTARDLLARHMTAEELARARTMAANEPAAPGAPPPAPAPVAAPVAAAEAPATAADIQEAQHRLQALGYGPGPADGRLGPRTRAAVRAYQAQAGLAVNGDVTPDLLSRLRGAPLPRGAASTSEGILAGSGRLAAYTEAVQQELHDHGYYQGPVSSAVGPRLRAAIREYQRDAGLAVTGEVSEALLDHLKFARPTVLKGQRAAR